MAQYNINYACGHGSCTKQLYGKMSERERRIEWMEENMICRECYRKQVSAKPLQATVIDNPFSDGRQLAITQGDSYKIKDDLKALGFRWCEYQDNKDILGISKPKRAWMIPIDIDKSDEIRSLCESLRDLGVESINVDNSPLALMSREVAGQLHRSLNSK